MIFFSHTKEQTANYRSSYEAFVTEWLALLTSYRNAPGSNPAGGEIHLMIVQRFFTQSV